MHHFWRVIQLERVEKLGADGVQIASRFVVTEECDASDAYKQAYIKATEDDVKIIKSPVGMPGRAINNKFLESLGGERDPFKCFGCLARCNPGVGFINEAMRGTLKIVKTSSDGKVKGFAFRVTGANGYDMTFETDKNGEIVIEGLRIGEYTVSEVANNASAAYITPADQNVTIKLDETAVVKMHNELRDTPKTGDDTNMKLWYVLAGLSAVGIAVTSVVAHKKKKKEGNE